MQSFSEQKVVIVGAGLAGTLAAVMFAQRGAKVELIERQTFSKDAAYSNRRSFNITVSTRGEAALKAAGIWDQVKKCTIPITGRMCHIGHDQTEFPYSRDNSIALHGARRSDVNEALLDEAAKYPSITKRFGHRVTELDKATGHVTIEDIETGVQTKIDDAQFVIGADGIHSTVRRLIHQGSNADYAQRFLNHGYREIFIPASKKKDAPFRMSKNALHVWPRGDLMMFALPNPDGSFTGNFIYPIEKDEDFAVPGRMTALFAEEFPDVYENSPDVEAQLRETPMSYFPTQRNSKWFHGNKFVLLGDAAHATVPFYGQGMNSAFESTVELIRCLEEHADQDRAVAFKTYQENRKPHTDAVADLSIENFDELRSNFARRIPQARRRLDVFLNRMFPNKYVPLHMLVSHSATDYKTAIDNCAKRDRVMRWFGMDLVVLTMAGVQIAKSSLGKLFAKKALQLEANLPDTAPQYGAAETNHS